MFRTRIAKLPKTVQVVPHVRQITFAMLTCEHVETQIQSRRQYVLRCEVQVQSRTASLGEQGDIEFGNRRRPTAAHGTLVVMEAFVASAFTPLQIS
jgi:hypothetical protein